MNRCDVTTYCDFLFQSSWQWWFLFFINLRQKKHFSSKFVPVFPWDKQSLCHPASPFYFSFVVYLRMLADHPAVIKEFLQGGGVASSTCLNGCLDIKRYRNGNSGALAYVWTPAVEKKKLLVGNLLLKSCQLCGWKRLLGVQAHSGSLKTLGFKPANCFLCCFLISLCLKTQING